MEKTQELEAEQAICAECARESPPDGGGWRTYLYDGDQPAPFCPECAEREFGAG
jgi:hypothetical protein